MRRPYLSFLLPILLLCLAGCLTFSRQPGYRAASYASVAESELILTSYRAADTLLAQAEGRLSPQHPIIVATLVNINALEESSPLGRLIAEQLGARLAQQGFRVVELKVRQKLYMKRDEGELMLTREIADIAQQHEAQALLIGTYAESVDRVFINLKLTQIESNIALAAVDYALPLDMNIRALLYRKPEP
ncbi:MAG: FlgO family outer membrane protein [Betaproteobacteria bacterium]|nr:FlgO family outer membrane protein [Betaproteobacteria bacterium]